MPKSTKRAAVIVAASLLVLGGAGVAFAYWTGGGSGVGTATTGTSSSLVVNQTDDIAPMFPGDSPQTLHGDFDNASSGAGPTHVSTVTASITGVTQDGETATGCSADDYSLAGAVMNVDEDVPVGTGVGTWSGATIQFNDTEANQDACQGAVVHLAYTVT